MFSAAGATNGAPGGSDGPVAAYTEAERERSNRSRCKALPAPKSAVTRSRVVRGSRLLHYVPFLQRTLRTD